MSTSWRAAMGAVVMALGATCAASAADATATGAGAATGEAPGACVLRLLRAPRVTVDSGVTWLSLAYAQRGFSCALRAGGKLQLEVLVGSGGQLHVYRTEHPRNAELREGAWPSDYCSKEGRPAQLQLRLTGSGALAGVGFTSAVLPSHCPCEAEAAPRAMLEPAAVSGTFDPRWQACAKGAGTGSLALRVYQGATAQEADAATRPALVLEHLESAPRFSRALPVAALCRDGARFVSADWVGRGDLRHLSGEALEAQPLRCTAER